MGVMAVLMGLLCVVMMAVVCVPMLVRVVRRRGRRHAGLARLPGGERR